MIVPGNMACLKHGCYTDECVWRGQQVLKLDVLVSPERERERVSLCVCTWIEPNRSWLPPSRPLRHGATVRCVCVFQAVTWKRKRCQVHRCWHAWSCGKMNLGLDPQIHSHQPSHGTWIWSLTRSTLNRIPWNGRPFSTLSLAQLEVQGTMFCIAGEKDSADVFLLSVNIVLHFEKVFVVRLWWGRGRASS